MMHIKTAAARREVIFDAFRNMRVALSELLLRLFEVTFGEPLAGRKGYF
jgi:hypothetical protein